MATSIRWQKSSFSGGDTHEDCVEVALSPAGVHLRESDAPGVVLTTDRAALRAFIRGVKAGPMDKLAEVVAADRREFGPVSDEARHRAEQEW